MPVRDLECTVREIIWMTPTVARLRFEAPKRFSFEAGQFVSVRVPTLGAKGGRRAYSIASPQVSDDSLYELCIKRVEGGAGSTYLTSLKPGESFVLSAPFGDFTYETSGDRNVCFIGTGSGVAPFRSMVGSKRFLMDRPRGALLVQGVRDESEILYPEEFEAAGLEVVYALSQPGDLWRGFRGRVTDYLRSLPSTWVWADTDFYLCGGGDMIREVVEILREERSVDASAIRKEAFFSNLAGRRKAA